MVFIEVFGKFLTNKLSKMHYFIRKKLFLYAYKRSFSRKNIVSEVVIGTYFFRQSIIERLNKCIILGTSLFIITISILRLLKTNYIIYLRCNCYIIIILTIIIIKVFRRDMVSVSGYHFTK